MPPRFGTQRFSPDLWMLTKNGKPVGIPMRKENAEHLAYWLEHNWYGLIYEAPEPDIYTPRGAHLYGRSVADTNAQWQDEVEATERYNATALKQKGR